MFRRGLLLLSGIAFVIAGALALGNPALTGVLLMVLIAFNLISDGGRTLLAVLNLRGSPHLAAYPRPALTVAVLRAIINVGLGLILVAALPSLQLADLVVLAGGWVILTNVVLPLAAMLLLAMTGERADLFGCQIYAGFIVGALVIALASVIASVIKALAGLALIAFGLMQIGAAVMLWRMGGGFSDQPPGLQG
jgi:uncharacterized membrane protein HdeD (DUF308 family)